jgi:hypothetical protein
MEVKKIYRYSEGNNPYAHGEQIYVEEVTMKDNAKFVNFFIINDDSEGCGIYLTKDEAIKLARSIYDAIKFNKDKG